MINRILTGWNFRRALYAAMGIAVIINSATNHEWFGILFGTYFASMGIFAFSCAGGNCYGGSCDTQPIKESITQIQDVDFEEIKTK